MSNFTDDVSAFAEAMQSNPPRLVVQFRRASNGDEEFEWGIVGMMPVLGLIGHIVRVQADLANEDWVPECSAPALVIAYDTTSRSFSHYLHPDAPRTPLIGMLEAIKAAMTMGRLGQHAVAQRFEPPILGPDGKPIRR